ncbi:MAG: xanthine/uracil permease family protein [Herbinix sp.]|nr:xanthine/uracil permease family protein [Herbinix sp.]
MEKFFKLKEHGTTVSTEVIAGLTTFFAMAYIIFVNPQMLSQRALDASGQVVYELIPYGAVFLATIIAAVIGTLVMGLFANVPYAQAPGMGLNAFFVYTVVYAIIITVTKLRKLIIKAIPTSLQHAIGGGIGVFIAYIGIKDAGLLSFTSDPGKYALLDSGTVIANSSAVPALVKLNEASVLLALIGIVITFILLVKKVKGSIFISIVATTIIGIPMGVVDLSNIGATTGLSESFSALGTTFGAAFGKEGLLVEDPVSLMQTMRKLWNLVPALSPKWTRHYLQILSLPV